MMTMMMFDPINANNKMSLISIRLSSLSSSPAAAGGGEDRFLREFLWHSFREKSFTDCTLHCCGSTNSSETSTTTVTGEEERNGNYRSFACHRLMLAAHCAFFRFVFFRKSKNNNHNHRSIENDDDCRKANSTCENIFITDIDARTLENILRLIYVGQIELPQTELEPFYSAANKLGLCEAKIVPNETISLINMAAVSKINSPNNLSNEFGSNFDHLKRRLTSATPPPPILPPFFGGEQQQRNRTLLLNKRAKTVPLDHGNVAPQIPIPMLELSALQQQTFSNNNNNHHNQNNNKDKQENNNSITKIREEISPNGSNLQQQQQRTAATNAQQHQRIHGDKMAPSGVIGFDVQSTPAAASTIESGIDTETISAANSPARSHEASTPADGANYTCNICQKSYSYKISLNKHIKSAHSNSN